MKTARLILALTLAALLPAVPAAADTQPPTLFQMVGVPLPPPRLADSVLLVIDAQREYRDGRLPLAGIDASLAEAARLLARARAAGTPVVHVVHRADGPLFNPKGDGYAIVDALKPLPGERVVVKTRANAFADTDLEQALRDSGRQQLVVVGYMTHNCVSATTRAALDHGYRVTVVAAATATRDLPDGRGGVIPAAAVQAANLAGLADATALVVAGGADIPD
jgi:nicotinamidase-related amidase